MLTSTIELKTEATELLLEKGLQSRPPSIPYPQKVEFVRKQSFILEGLKRRKVLTGTEVTNVHANILTNQLGTCIRRKGSVGTVLLLHFFSRCKGANLL